MAVYYLGIEPATFRLQGQFLNHYTTLPPQCPFRRAFDTDRDRHIPDCQHSRTSKTEEWFYHDPAPFNRHRSLSYHTNISTLSMTALRSMQQLTIETPHPHLLLKNAFFPLILSLSKDFYGVVCYNCNVCLQNANPMDYKLL
ncbi:hypothetical protein SKAU_G00346320, partial [Synaphobranchus kaupii]